MVLVSRKTIFEHAFERYVGEYLEGVPGVFEESPWRFLERCAGGVLGRLLRSPSSDHVDDRKKRPTNSSFEINEKDLPAVYIFRHWRQRPSRSSER
jgi:hypothetical protein